MRTWWLAVPPVAAAAFLASVAAAPGYRATTTLVVRANGVPAALPTVAALATSDVVVHNVAAALRLPDGHVRGGLRASSVGRSALVRVRYRDSSGVRAREVAQQAASVLQAVAAARLGSAVRVEVVDPARAVRSSRRWARAVVLGMLAGVAAAVFLYGLRRREPAPARDPRADAHDVLVQIRATLAERESEFAEHELLEWYALLGVFSAEADRGRLPPGVERVARERFSSLLGP